MITNGLVSARIRETEGLLVSDASLALGVIGFMFPQHSYRNSVSVVPVKLDLDVGVHVLAEKVIGCELATRRLVIDNDSGGVLDSVTVALLGFKNENDLAIIGAANMSRDLIPRDGFGKPDLFVEHVATSLCCSCFPESFQHLFPEGKGNRDPEGRAWVLK